MTDEYQNAWTSLATEFLQYKAAARQRDEWKEFFDWMDTAATDHEDLYVLLPKDKFEQIIEKVLYG